jgi:hypothetical protein
MADSHKGLKIICIVNLVAAVLTLVFWVLVFVRLFATAPIDDPALRASAAATLGFLVGDLIWAVPLLVLSVIGLGKRRLWGWLTAFLVNILWFYSMTVIWCRDLYTGKASPGAILFAPFVVFAAWSTIYLWRHRAVIRQE